MCSPRTKAQGSGADTTTEVAAFECPSFAGSKGAFTQYKAMTASQPNKISNTPDGAMIPGTRRSIGALIDGTSCTAMAGETNVPGTMWSSGATACLAGLPNSVSIVASNMGNYLAPAGYDGTYGVGSGTETTPTLLLVPAGPESPTSDHPGVVNMVFGDGSVHSVNKEIDAALLYFVITVANRDPGMDFHTAGAE